LSGVRLRVSKCLGERTLSLSLFLNDDSDTVTDTGDSPASVSDLENRGHIAVPRKNGNSPYRHCAIKHLAGCPGRTPRRHSGFERAGGGAREGDEMARRAS